MTLNDLLYKKIILNLIVRFLLTHILILFTLLIKSQTWINVTNQYISNPSFEDYTACPEGFSDPANYWIDSCKGWSHVTYASPDLITLCSSAFSPLMGIPYNYVMTYQWPFHGNSYVGFFAYTTLNDKLWCEYVQTKLIKPLIINTKYKFTMRLSTSNSNLHGVSKIGVHLSNASLSNYSQETSFKFTPTMHNSKGCLYDTLGWMLFEEEFVAKGDENYLTIGWFSDTSTTDCAYFDPIFNQFYYGPVYYGLDSLNLQEVTNNNTISDFAINVITPNNDGVNDYIDFDMYNLSALSFSVYNRWGSLIFTSNDIHLKWDGLSNYNSKLNDGMYFYVLSAEISNIKDKIQKQGYISIIN